MNKFEEYIKYNILYVDKYIFGKSWFYKENKVPYSLLRYIVEGEGVFEISGEKIVVAKGDIVYIPDGSLLECKSNSSKFSFISIRFKTSVFFEGLDFLTEYYKMPKLIKGDAGLERYFININNSSKDHSSTRMLKMHGNLELLIAKLIEESRRINGINDKDIQNKYNKELSTIEINKKINSKDLREDPRISMVIDYILTHPTQKYNSSIIKEMSGLSESTFRRLFKKQTGKTPNEFIRNLKLITSARMLLLTDDYINEISYKVGFSDVNYFIRIFKEHFGLTPKQYRETAQ